MPVLSLEFVNFWVALGAVGMQVLAIALLAFYFVRKDFPVLSGLVERWGLWFGFLVMLASFVMSLYYSDVLGILPCSLCWFQRVFLYSQMVIFAVALAKREAARIADYAIVLSVLGGAVSLYNHYIQMVGESPLPCPAGTGDCVKRFLFEFDYMTFPLVGFSAFALIIIVMLFVRQQKA